MRFDESFRRVSELSHQTDAYICFMNEWLVLVSRRYILREPRYELFEYSTV